MQQGAGAGLSMCGTAARLAADEAPLALYTGLEAYALRQIVWNGGFFGLLGLGNAVLPPTAGGSKALLARKLARFRAAAGVWSLGWLFSAAQ